jgi:hypothetical protein
MAKKQKQKIVSLNIDEKTRLVDSLRNASLPESDREILISALDTVEHLQNCLLSKKISISKLQKLFGSTPETQSHLFGSDTHNNPESKNKNTADSSASANSTNSSSVKKKALGAAE